ncbi:MAG: hypothetical protein Q4G44_10460 [Alcaligenaceae bacterium]|nr:hypothetical protein [Alcaligenaceae bacterium]
MPSLLTIDSQNTAPHLDKKGLAIFEDYVSNASCYLEYGSGASTWHAHQLGARHIISVDSSEDWHKNVKNQLKGVNNIDLLYCDIGTVGNWGKPVNDEGIKDYHSYMVTPWKIAYEKNLDVDLIMVDGRFRVACFLYSLLCAKPGTVILFDDYGLRFRYHVVEKFCTKVDSYGRLAEFRVEKDYDLPELVACIAKYSIIKD